MNIKEHIEAGHYPKDSLKRAIVPMRAGGFAVIYATNAPGDAPLVGFIGQEENRSRPDGEWKIDGSRCGWGEPWDLIPPPPRKAKVSEWALIREGRVWTWYQTEEKARRCAHDGDQIVLMTGEYEEPWS